MDTYYELDERPPPIGGCFEYLKYIPDAIRDNMSLLPAEILLAIFEQLRTVEELWSFACASKRLYRLFHKQALRLLEHVLVDDTHPWIRSVMNATLNVLACDVRPYSYAELRHIDSCESYRPMTKNAKSETVRRFVTIARKIHAMAHIMLENCCKNLWGLRGKLRPADFQEDLPELESYLDEEANPGDETRFVLGLWLCELHVALIHSIKTKSPAWVCQMFGSMRKENRNIWGFFRRAWHGTLVTILYSICILQIPKDKAKDHFSLKPPMPVYIAIPKLPKSGFQHGLYCWTELPNYSPHKARGRMQITQMGNTMRQRPSMTQYFSSTLAMAPMDDVLHRLPWQAFVGLGLFHWENEKLDDMSLLPNAAMSQHEQFAYLKSFITDEAIAYYADIQREEKLAYWQREAGRAQTGMPDIQPGEDYDYYQQMEVDTEDEAARVEEEDAIETSDEEDEEDDEQGDEDEASDEEDNEEDEPNEAL